MAPPSNVAPTLTTASSDARTVQVHRRPRWAAVDVLRGVAIVGVVAYHLLWDLADLGFIGWHIGVDPVGKVIGHSISGTFLFLVGASLVLAHGDGVRWRSFWRREAQLVALALLLTAATYVYSRDQVVTFGILHAIALISVLTVLFVRLPVVVTLLAAALAVALPWLVHLSGTSPWVSWTGLADGTRPSLDWQPVLPWIAATFLGIVVMRGLVRAGDRGSRPALALRAWQPGGFTGRWLVTAGRHTLSIYLLHQPILYGVLWCLSTAL